MIRNGSCTTAQTILPPPMLTAAYTLAPSSTCPQTGTYPNTSLEPALMPLKTHGIKNPSQDLDNASGVERPLMTPLTATSYSSVSFAVHGDIMRLTARSPIVDAKPGISVE